MRDVYCRKTSSQAAFRTKYPWKTSSHSLTLCPLVLQEFGHCHRRCAPGERPQLCRQLQNKSTVHSSNFRVIRNCTQREKKKGEGGKYSPNFFCAEHRHLFSSVCCRQFTPPLQKQSLCAKALSSDFPIS